MSSCSAWYQPGCCNSILTMQVWSKQDYAFLVDKLKDTFPCYHYYHWWGYTPPVQLDRCVYSLSLSLSPHSHSGIVGSGLCVFSRHPIMAAHTHQFTLTGGVRDIADGEVFAGKGILLTRLKTPEGTVAFYNTHVRERSTLMYVKDCSSILW